MAVHGFSWVIDGQLAGLAMPGSFGGLEGDLEQLSANNIRLLVSFNESAVNPDLLARHDISPLHLPVEDFHPPTSAQLERFVVEADMTIRQGGAVGVHCRAGKGRTGTALAAYLAAHGMEAGKAIAEVRRMRPGSIETSEQEQAVREFAVYWKKR